MMVDDARLTVSACFQSDDARKINVAENCMKRGRAGQVRAPQDRAGQVCIDQKKANVTKVVMRRFMALAKIVPNPFAGITPYKLSTHHMWTEEELSAFEAHWPRGTMQRRAYDLLLETDQRVSDVSCMQAGDIKNGMVHVIQSKTGTELWLPAKVPGLPKRGHRITDTKGQPMNASALSALIKRAAEAAGLPPRLDASSVKNSFFTPRPVLALPRAALDAPPTGCARMRRLAESGATAKETAAVSGHKSLKEIERYSAAADQAMLAAAATKKLSGRSRKSV
jgi:hypothetical protein